MDPKTIQSKARSLMSRVVENCLNPSQNSWTPAVYDTAWVSMVVTPRGEWLFPECFQYVLERQAEDGGWHDGGFEIDGILNTMAALLAIHRRLHNPDNTTPLSKAESLDLWHRSCRGLHFLRKALGSWDVQSCTHVGFEVLVPSLLSMLEEDGIDITFPGHAELMALNKEKLSKLDMRMVYGPRQTTLLHSLEAFVGTCDFTKVRHHQVQGSLLGSPSSTAALLMNDPEWNTAAEEFLRRVVKASATSPSGARGIPSAWSYDVFELSWIATTMMEGGLSDVIRTVDWLPEVMNKFHNIFQEQNGIMGFSKGFLPDADDTAKTITLLNTFGEPVSAKALLANFSAKNGRIATYPFERNLSISANCNTLHALLLSPDLSEIEGNVIAITRNLCNSWVSGQVTDKWNVSPEYPAMLLAQGLGGVLRVRNEGKLPGLPSELLEFDIPLVTTQILNQTLMSSGDIPSEPCEVVAYKLLTLNALAELPWVAPLIPPINSAIEKCRECLLAREDRWAKGEHLWIEKVTYGFDNLSEAYCIAAVHAQPVKVDWCPEISNLVAAKRQMKNRKLAQWYQRVYNNGQESQWRVDASVLEGCFFTARLKATAHEVFPERAEVKDQYLEYIPAVWTIVNNCENLRVPAKVLWELMVISMQGYLVDEFLELNVTQLDGDDIQGFKRYIDLVHSAANPYRSGPPVDTNGFYPEDSKLAHMKSVIRTYMESVQQHPIVGRASIHDRMEINNELRLYLQAHLTQIEQNMEFLPEPSAEASTSVPKLTSSFYNWSHTTASYHTSCQISFAFLCCLLSQDRGDQKDCLTTPEQKYLGNEFCSHLAVMSRLYNDYGSIARDQREGNLNSVNFPECRPDSGSSFQDMKPSLLKLSHYERRCAKAALDGLLEEMGCTGSQRVKNGMTLFYSGAALFGDIYVAKDITSNVKSS